MPVRRSARALAATALLSTVLAGAPAAQAATPSPGVLPNLPWGLLAGAVDAADLVTSPITGLSSFVDRVGQSFGPLKPVGHALGLAGAAMPLGADALRLLGTLAGTPQPSSPSSPADSPGTPATWRLPTLPDLEEQVEPLSAEVADLSGRIDDAVACDCLPFGLTDRLAGLASDAADAAWALESFAPMLAAYPELAGFDGPRTYLVVIGNQAEMRASGGAPLYAAVVTADDGAITIIEKGATSTHFFPPLNRPVTWSGVPGNPYFADNPRTQPFVNAGTNPDFAMSGSELASAFAAGGHPAVDGVVYVDLTFLQEVLRVTGPVAADGAGTVDADSLSAQLLDNAYQQTGSPEENTRRQAANDALVEALLGRVAAGVPAMPALRAIDKAADGRHLQVWFRDASTQTTFDGLGWTGRLSAPADGADWLAWFTQSGNPSKTDIKQGRTAMRSVRIDDSVARVTTEYVVTNDNPPSTDASLDDRRGYRATWMKTAILVYLPPGATDIAASAGEMQEAPLPGATLDGPVMTDASGNRFLRFSGWIRPLDSATVSVEYSLPVASGDAPYRVVLEPQANLLPYSAAMCVEGDPPVCVGPAPVTHRTTVALP